MNLTAILASIVVIVLPLGFTIPGTYYVCGDIGGVYVDGKIYVCDIDENKEYYKNHEVFHKIWNELMEDEDKQEYIELYAQHNKIGKKAFYRDYSRTTVEEDFCDNGALLVAKENSNPFVMKRIRLIKKIIENL